MRFLGWIGEGIRGRAAHGFIMVDFGFAQERPWFVRVIWRFGWDDVS